MTVQRPPDDYEVILGNSNKRFSGVTSTMLQTLEVQVDVMKVAVLGSHHLPEHLKCNAVSFLEVAKHCRRPLPDGRLRVFHARRNDEIIQALILKHVFRAKIKIVFTSTAQRYHSGFTRWLMSKVDCTLSTCEAAASYLKDRPSAIIPHGIQTDIYHPDSSQRDSDTVTVGMFGRVREQKGTHLFIQACIDVFPSIPYAKAIIVGAITPDNITWVENLKKDILGAGLENRIVFLGEQNFDSLPKLFQSVSLVAALSRTEGYGLTVLEALSSGAAVLATQAGAWPEIIEEGVHGYVVPVNNQNAITAKLSTLLSDRDKLYAMGLAGRKRVLENYKIETEANKLCDIYRSLQ